MLRQRLLTAAVVIPLAVAAVWFLPNSAFAVLVGLFVLAGAWEWVTLMRAPRSIALASFGGSVLGFMVLAWWLHGNVIAVFLVMILAFAWWVWCFLLVRDYPSAPLRHRRMGSLARGIAGLLVLVPAFLSLVVLHALAPRGPLWVLFLLVLVWAADTGAYFVGRAIGRHKLIPRVSPGKTWEGVGGGLALGLFISAVAGIWLFGLQGWQLIGFLILCAGVIAISVVGDLTISIMKRLAGVKDSGRLFPGHGGVLDRLDSLLAAAPCFVLGILSLGLQ